MTGEPVPPPWWTDPTENVKGLVEADRRRQDDLREMQAGHLRELMAAETRRMDEKADLRARHADEMRAAEADRINAIRAVDVGAVAAAAQVAEARANTLAAQVSTTADAFRATLAAALEPIQKDIRDVRDLQSVGRGAKEQVTESRDVRASSQLSVNMVVGVAGLLLTVIILAVGMVAAFRK